MSAELVPAAPHIVNSEVQLSQQLEAIRTGLQLQNDWQKRVAHLVSLEALLMGGASRHGCFSEELRRLVDPLSLQLSDRQASCPSTSRQGCPQFLRLAL